MRKFSRPTSEAALCLWAYWSPILGTYVGVYVVISDSGVHTRSLRCDTYDEIQDDEQSPPKARLRLCHSRPRESFELLG